MTHRTRQQTLLVSEPFICLTINKAAHLSFCTLLLLCVKCYNLRLLTHLSVQYSKLTILTIYAWNHTDWSSMWSFQQSWDRELGKDIQITVNREGKAQQKHEQESCIIMLIMQILVGMSGLGNSGLSEQLEGYSNKWRQVNQVHDSWFCLALLRLS